MDLEWKWMCDRFSRERLAPYLREANGDTARAAALYWWNSEVSGALHWSLGMVEVAVRNALHTRMRDLCGRDDWWGKAPLRGKGPGLVAQAEKRCRQEKKGAVSPGDVVAELSFGFWVSLLAQRYDRDLWVPGLHLAFPHYRGRRDALHGEVDEVRRLRNRVMHHEPVHRIDLLTAHQRIYLLMAWMDQPLESRARKLDRVPDILRRKP